MKKILSIVLALVLVCGLAITAMAANVNVSVEPGVVAVGDTVTVTVTLDEAISIDAGSTVVQGQVNYDGTALSYVEGKAGEGYEYLTIVKHKKYDRINLNYLSMDDPQVPVELPAGTVAVLTFTALEATTVAELEITVSLVAQDPSGTDTLAKVTAEATVTVCPEHSVVTDTVAATCTEDGAVTESCASCGYSKVVETIAATGHTEGDAVAENASEAACTEGGSYDEVVYCSVCQEELSRETVTIDATGHTEADAVKENEVAATCTTDGSYDEVVYCSVCNEELSRTSVTVTSAGHSYESEETVAGTCMNPAEITYTCSVCGDTYTEEGDFGDHPELAYTAEVPATCTEDGCGAYYYCETCGIFFDESGMNTHPRWLWVPATGHSYEYTVVWAEDYSSATVVGTCSVCGETVELEATVTSKETEVTCEEDGKITYTAEVTVDDETLTFTAEVVTEEHPGHVDENEDDYCDVCSNPMTGDFTIVVAAAAAVISLTGAVALPVAKKKFF